MTSTAVAHPSPVPETTTSPSVAPTQTATGSTTAAPSLTAPAPAPAAGAATSATPTAPPQTSTAPQAAASGPTSAPRAAQPTKRRKKKTGLAALFAMLGCGSSDTFEHEPKRKDAHAQDKGRTGPHAHGGLANVAGKSGAVSAGQTAPQKEKAPVGPGAGKVSIPGAAAREEGGAQSVTTTQSNTAPKGSAPADAPGAAGPSPVVVAPATPTRNGTGNGNSGPSATEASLALGSVAAVAGAGTVLALGKGRDNLEVRVPTPTKTTAQTETPPLDETEGLTSGAVQPPGSGGQFLHPSHSGTQTHLHPHPYTHTSSSHTQGTEISSDLLTDTDDLTSSGGDGPRSEANGDVAAYTGAGGAQQQQQQQYQAALAEEDMDKDLDEMDEEDRLISQGGIGIPRDAEGNLVPLLPPMSSEHTGRKCLVLDLDETLLHSSFKAIPSADYIVPVEIESQTHNVYVIKRPGVDNFLRQMGEIYEVVVFTASLSKYADPVLDMLDIHGVVKHRLFRESCYNHNGNYVKDLSQLGREMHQCIIIDNSPASYIFHPNNAVPVSTWFNDPHDTELTDLCPFLADLETVDDIRGVLDGSL